jgi:flagella basal body P-ring formation protein FlgA
MMIRKYPLWLIVVLLFGVIGIVVVRNMLVLGGSRRLGRSQVVAVRDLQEGRQLTGDDLKIVYSLGRPDVFTDTTDLVNAYTTMAISKSQPILHSQVERYQVVAKQKLDADHTITKDDLDLHLTPYRAQAYTDVEQVIGLRTQQPITQGAVILSSEFAYHVVARDKLISGTTISEVDVALVFVDAGKDQGVFTDMAQVAGLVVSGTIEQGDLIQKDEVLVKPVVAHKRLTKGYLITDTKPITLDKPRAYTDTVFTEPEQLKDHYTLETVKAGKEIYRSQVKACEIAAGRDIPAYHQVITDDLAAEQECSPLINDLRDHYTLKPFKKGDEITQEDLVPIPPGLDLPLTDMVAIPLTVPESTAFGGQLKTGDVAHIFLVQPSEDVSQTNVLTIPHRILLLSVTELEAGLAGTGQAEGEDTVPQEPSLLIVAAIPITDEHDFVAWLPFSEVVLSVATD